jgi:ADP-heptose:LPS heptosyltransferase
MAIDFRGDFRHLLLARLIGAKRRVGYGIRGGGFLLTERVPYEENAHEVEKNLDLVRRMGGKQGFSSLELSLHPEDLRYADSVFESLRLGPDSIVVGLCPCSRNRSRWWHARGFSEVCRYLTENLKAHVLIFGDRSCAGFVAEIVTPLASRRVTSLVGKTSLRQFAACLKRVDFIVSIESSPIHFASAVGKPIVVLFGGTSLPETWGPYNVPHKVVKAEVECAPCFQLICPLDEVRCMESITPGDVVGACSSLVEDLARMDPELKRKLNRWQSSP